MAEKMFRPANRIHSFSLPVPQISREMARDLARFTKALALSSSIAALSMCVGCGKSEVAQATANPTSASSGVTAESAPTQVTPTDVVSQFLDQVRRGGANSEAGQFLTQKAQSELKRIGRSVQPIGSPDAHFDVIRAVKVPEEDNAMLVESRWTEPNPDGTKSEFQVVWSVEQESTGWRISGLALLEEGTETPTVIDFENGNMMAQWLADDAGEDPGLANSPAPSSGNPSQAAAPSEGVNR